MKYLHNAFFVRNQTEKLSSCTAFKKTQRQASRKQLWSNLRERAQKGFNRIVDFLVDVRIQGRIMAATRNSSVCQRKALAFNVAWYDGAGRAQTAECIEDGRCEEDDDANSPNKIQTVGNGRTIKWCAECTVALRAPARLTARAREAETPCSSWPIVAACLFTAQYRITLCNPLPAVPIQNYSVCTVERGTQYAGVFFQSCNAVLFCTSNIFFTRGALPTYF